MTGRHVGPGKRLKLELFAKLQDKRIEEHRLYLYARKDIDTLAIQTLFLFYSLR